MVLGSCKEGFDGSWCTRYWRSWARHVELRGCQGAGPAPHTAPVGQDRNALETILDRRTSAWPTRVTRSVGSLFPQVVLKRQEGKESEKGGGLRVPVRSWLFYVGCSYLYPLCCYTRQGRQQPWNPSVHIPRSCKLQGTERYHIYIK